LLVFAALAKLNDVGDLSIRQTQVAQFSD